MHLWNIKSEKRRLRSVCACAQTDMSLSFAPMPQTIFYRGMAQKRLPMGYH